METARTEDGWEKNLKNAAGEGKYESAREAVRAFQKEAKVLIINEAHLIFGCPGTWSDLTKLWRPKVKILLFSSAATGTMSTGTVLAASPNNIHHKYM